MQWSQLLHSIVRLHVHAAQVSVDSQLGCAENNATALGEKDKQITSGRASISNIRLRSCEGQTDCKRIGMGCKVREVMRIVG